MKILTITDDCPPFALGGSGRIAWEVSMGLTRRGHEVHLLTAVPAQCLDTTSRVISRVAPSTKYEGCIEGSGLATRHDTDSIQMHLLPELPKRWAHYRSVFSKKRAREILSVIDAVKPDLIHAHGLAWQMGYLWIATAQKKNIPVFYTAHGVMHLAYGKKLGTEWLPLFHDLHRARWTYNPARNLLVKRALKHCSTLLCVSDALHMYLEFRGSCHFRTLRNGIDLNFWHPLTSQEEARKLLALPQQKTVFLLAGRLGRDKGADATHRAFPKDAFLIAAGDIPAGTFAGMSNQVRTFPHQTPEQMRLLYCACDAVLVPSLYLDPFPTVTLEAQACSRPVIATCFGGAKEAITEGTTGWIVNPLDTDAFRKRLEWCSTYRTELPAFGKAARTYMMQRFSIEEYLDVLEALYREARSRP